MLSLGAQLRGWSQQCVHPDVSRKAANCVQTNVCFVSLPKSGGPHLLDELPQTHDIAVEKFCSLGLGISDRLTLWYGILVCRLIAPPGLESSTRHSEQ